MVKRLQRFQVQTGPATPRDLPDFLIIAEVHFSGQRCLQVLLHKLAYPAVSVHERHIDPVALALPSALRAKPFSRRLRGRKSRSTKRADTARSDLANSRCPVTCHGKSITQFRFLFSTARLERRRHAITL